MGDTKSEVVVKVDSLEFADLAISAGRAVYLGNKVLTELLHGNLCRPTMEKAQEWIDVSSGDAQAQFRDAEVPASDGEIRRELAALIACFNTKKDDLSIFGRFLVVDVTALKPSRYAIHRGIQKVRTTKTYFPSIAEVVEAITDAQSELRMFATAVRVMPGHVALAKAKLCVSADIAA